MRELLKERLENLGVNIKFGEDGLGSCTVKLSYEYGLAEFKVYVDGDGRFIPGSPTFNCSTLASARRLLRAAETAHNLLWGANVGDNKGREL